MSFFTEREIRPEVKFLVAQAFDLIDTILPGKHQQYYGSVNEADGQKYSTPIFRRSRPNGERNNDRSGSTLFNFSIFDQCLADTAEFEVQPPKSICIRDQESTGTCSNNIVQARCSPNIAGVSQAELSWADIEDEHHP
jgi:hypothetical protein